MCSKVTHGSATCTVKGKSKGESGAVHHATEVDCVVVTDYEMAVVHICLPGVFFSTLIEKLLYRGKSKMVPLKVSFKRCCTYICVVFIVSVRGH